MPSSTIGISCLAHDGAVAVLTGDSITFAAHSERYSRTKNDPLLNGAILADALSHAENPDAVVYYERPFSKRLRHVRSRQFRRFLEIGPRAYLSRFPELARLPLRTVSHHASHAAGAYFTAPFRDAAVVVVDAIGEWETLSVWHARDRRLNRIYRLRYPHSVGLFYSAFTQRLGFKPNEEEYIFMGASAYGEPRYRHLIESELIRSRQAPEFRLRRSMHRGVRDWRPEIPAGPDLARSVQDIVTDFLIDLFRWVAEHVPSRNLVYTGGVALNCVANGRIAQLGIFDEIWIPPNPGDAGSALGALLADRQGFVPWPGPYLGHDIRRRVDPEEVAEALVTRRIVGLANGRAEYGPRALGNRSLLADPRGEDVKDRVNEIKRRQKYRPFAPVVLAERAIEFFEMPVPEASYMQYVVPCRQPDKYPAICHIDGTSRVQTVRPDQNPLLHEVIAAFERRTGCPLLLNTSLNVRGEPLANTWEDAENFSRRYRIPVF